MPHLAAGRRHGSRSKSASERMLVWGSVAVLTVVLLLGGAGTSYPVVGGLVEALAVALIVLLGFSGRLVPTAAGTTFPSCVCLLILAVPILQLVPMPPAIWLSLPGHALPAQILAGADVPLGWRPLSLDPALTEMTVLELLPGIALFFTALQLREKERLQLMSVVVGVAVLSALLGAVQKIGLSGSPLVLFTTANSGNSPGLFVNRNHQACFLLASMPLLASLVRASPTARRLGEFERSMIFLALLALLGAGALATTSRMGLLLLLPATLAALAIRFGAQRRRAYLFGALSIAAFAAALAGFSSAFDVVVTRLSDEDSRTLYWAATREAIVRFWPTGSGIGTFPHIYAVVEHLETMDASFPYNAHDDYLELLLEGGAPALLLMFAAGGFLVLSMVRLLRRSTSGDVSAGLAAWCSIVLILLHSIVDYPLRMMSIMALFGLLAGIVARTAVVTAGGQEQSHLSSRGAGGRSILPRRRAVLTSAIVIPIALLCLVRITMTTGAQSLFFADDFPRAFMLAPNWSDASATLAQQRLRERKLAEAHALASKATNSSPLDPQGSTALALIDQAQGADAAADRIFNGLSQLGWRHAPAQYLLAFRAADRGDLTAAIPRVDTLLRQGLYKAQFFPFLRAATAYPDGLAALARQLSFGPKWRSDYLQNLADLRPVDFPGHEALLVRMRRGQSPTTQAEVDAYLQRVALAADYRAAAVASDRLLGTAPNGNQIRDGSFRRFMDRPETPSPFDWQPVAGTEARVDASATGVHVTASGPASGMILRQILAAPPGLYRLASKFRPGNAASSGALRWALRCLGGPYLQAVQNAQTTVPGRYTFVIPGTNCATQQIELMVDHQSGDPLDISVSEVDLIGQ